MKTITRSAWVGVTTSFVVFATVSNLQTEAKTLYVRANRSQAGETNGLSWATAFTRISDSTTKAQVGDQIWVATGRYAEWVGLPPEVALYGGFDGTESRFEERDWEKNQAVIDRNYVVTAVGATPMTRLDGFVIQNALRAAITCDRGSPTIANNRIVDTSGRGIEIRSASPFITNNLITANFAPNLTGGGIYSESGSPVIVHNRIIGNIAAYAGGVFVRGGSPRITDNLILGNYSTGASGIGLRKRARIT